MKPGTWDQLIAQLELKLERVKKQLASACARQGAGEPFPQPSCSPRRRGVNLRKLGLNPRAKGTNPRASLGGSGGGPS